MKALKFIAVLLSLVLLWGCGEDRQGSQPVSFYYLRTEIDYESSEGVIAPEERSESGDMKALLELYLEGPTSDDLKSPFPIGLSIDKVQDEGSHLTVVFNPRLAVLKGMDLSLACGCFAKTCFSLTGTEEVRISATDTLLDGQSQIIITTDSLLLSEES